MSSPRTRLDIERAADEWLAQNGLLARRCPRLTRRRGQPMTLFAEGSLWELPDPRNDADGFHPGCPDCDAHVAAIAAFAAVFPR